MRCIDLRTLFRISISILVSLVLVGWLVGPPMFARAQGISYLYDATGRLIAVVVPGTGTAVYAYDAVGNLLSITRYAATALLIVDFSPGQGPVGSTVTISGVRFNGTQAMVSAATTTQLTVTVPAGATTGSINVTTAGGSSTSSSSFTVTGASGTPTISDFSPAIGTAGTAVTLNG